MVVKEWHIQLKAAKLPVSVFSEFSAATAIDSCDS